MTVETECTEDMLVPNRVGVRSSYVEQENLPY